MTDKEFQAYSHYVTYCANIGITPASKDTYLKETNTLESSVRCSKKFFPHKTVKLQAALDTYRASVKRHREAGTLADLNSRLAPWMEQRGYSC